MSCMSGIMPDSTGCGSVSSQTLQRRQMCQMPENDMTHTLSYPATHQHFLHHPHQHHQNISASMQTQVQQHQHPDIAENNAAAAAVAASQLAALRQLLFNANAQANQQSLLDKFLLQENQQLQQHLQKTGFFSDGGDFNLPSAELYSVCVVAFFLFLFLIIKNSLIVVLTLTHNDASTFLIITEKCSKWTLAIC